MDKCARCGMPIIWGMKFVTLAKDDKIAYMCEECYRATSKEQEDRHRKAKE